MNSHRHLCASVLCLLLAHAAAAADIIAIANGRLLTMGRGGEIAPGTVLIRDGVIAAVGADVNIPADARIIDATGKTVTPGLIATNTTLSLIEVEGFETTNDYATHNARLSAGFDVQYGINADSTQIPIVRMGGVTRAIVSPRATSGRESAAALFAGQAAVIHLGEGPELLVKPQVGVVVDLSEPTVARAGGGRGSAFVLLMSVLDDVRHYARHRQDFDRNQSRPYSLAREDLEALIPIVERRAPLIITAHRAADILQVLQLAREQNVAVILEGAGEGWRVAQQIARARIPVILQPDANLPQRFEITAASSENAARLHAAGVLIAIETTTPLFMARTPRFAAGRAVARGLPFEAALAAITINPALIWKIERRVGSLEAGKDADVVIWSGDPLELASAPVAIFIQGREQELRSRQSELRDRYSITDSAYPPAYH